jgi:hypothetical protein
MEGVLVSDGGPTLLIWWDTRLCFKMRKICIQYKVFDDSQRELNSSRTYHKFTHPYILG